MGIWKKWSMTHRLAMPACSASLTIRPNVGRIRAGPPGHVKLETASPIFNAQLPWLATSSTLLDLAVARVLGVPLKQEHQAERSTPPPLVVHRDTHTTSPHPHPPDRLRRGPLPIHPAQGPAPLGPELPARAAAGRQAQVDPAHGRPAGPRRPR